ncbi:N-acetylmuramoyl-L-alanine amidase [Virgibacillus sp. AGTR]|uniref:N-acetylmuramoyl-L-alanine amidase n=1 Tax=Virgibacillus sp. AGTR TaxID=2812055 RepID=UPI00272A8D9F|nr:N-acetylmuramoyl-L-alanine amidase [Virgibacillus sp. AGTR]
MPKIIKDFIPKSQTNQRPGHSMKPRYLTVHGTANEKKGADAEMHSRYLHNGAGGRVVAWHYTVDDKEIYQHIPTNENGWHAGDGNGTGNRQSIGIEICENSDGDFNKAVKNAQWLIKKLMKEHNIPIERVVPHKHWSGKNCPRLLLNMWSTFIDGIEGKTVEAPNQQVGSETVTNGSIVDYLNSIGKDASFSARKKYAAEYGIKGYKGTEDQNLELLHKMREGKPSKPSQAKGTVHLPASAKTWRTYKLNVKPVKKNSDWSLTPARYGGLTYKILDKPYPDVVTIKTGRGKRNIYVGSGTSAIIK